MKKKLFIGIIIFLTTIIMLPTIVFADMGPKPSVRLNISGINDEVYYTTLLSSDKSSGPYRYSGSIDGDSFLVNESTKDDDMNAWQAFIEYSDNSGFYFINHFERYNSENTFAWTYWPPQKFKVLIYFPQSDTFKVSSVQERYAFDSYFDVTVVEGELSVDAVGLQVKQNYDFTLEIWSLVARIFLTLVVEIGIALLFNLRKKNIILFIASINIITQVILNVLLNAINYSSGGFAFVFHYVWMELLIIVIEGIIFAKYFKKAKAEKPIKRWVAPVYSIVSNAASFGVGLILAICLPGIF